MSAATASTSEEGNSVRTMIFSVVPRSSPFSHTVFLSIIRTFVKNNYEVYRSVKAVVNLGSQISAII